MIKLFADGADMNGIIEASKDKMIKGFTTNPTLMRQAGITDYTSFAKSAISYLAGNRPETNLSLEVFADEPNEIIRQARLINSWGEEVGYDVYVKIPVMHTDGRNTYNIIKQLSDEGIKLNVTAIFTVSQIKNVINFLNPNTKAIISVFAGRIADAGYDATAIITEGVLYYDSVRGITSSFEFLWASSRQAYAYREAENAGCDIITMPNDLIKKVKAFGKDLTQFSQETCQMFYDDAIKSGFTI
jgi:transaldolase